MSKKDIKKYNEHVLYVYSIENADHKYGLTFVISSAVAWKIAFIDSCIGLDLELQQVFVYTSEFTNSACSPPIGLARAERSGALAPSPSFRAGSTFG